MNTEHAVILPTISFPFALVSYVTRLTLALEWSLGHVSGSTSSKFTTGTFRLAIIRDFRTITTYMISGGGKNNVYVDRLVAISVKPGNLTLLCSTSPSCAFDSLHYQLSEKIENSIRAIVILTGPSFSTMALIRGLEIFTGAPIETNRSAALALVYIIVAKFAHPTIVTSTPKAMDEIRAFTMYTW